MSKKVRLEHGLVFGEQNVNHGQPGEKGQFIDKEAVLVYPGVFNSMDGEVVITDETIRKICENYNAKLQKTKLSDQEPNLRECAPIQLDHSTSAKDTVGRLIGPLTVAETDIEGEGKKFALFGKLRFLGYENVDKVKDGRWTHLSIGADIENCTISELTVTPFPAAARAMMLSSGKVELPGKVDEAKWDEAKKAAKKSYPNISENSDKFWSIVSTIYKNMGGTFEHKMSKENAMNKEKMKKFLMDEKKMSADEAEAQMAKMGADDSEEMKKLAAEIEEHEKKMSAEADPTKMSGDADPTKMSEEADPTKMSGDADPTKMAEDEKEKEKEAKMTSESDEEIKKKAEDIAKHEEEEKKEKKGEMKSKMSAEVKTKFIKLAKSIKTSSDKIRLEAKKTKIISRLSALRKEGKLSPAELKGFSVEQIAKLDDNGMEVLFGTLSKLSKKLDTSVVGDANAENLAHVRQKISMARLELETRMNMPMKRDAAMKHLKELEQQEAKLVALSEGSSQKEEAVSMSHYESKYNDICKMMDEGKDKEEIKKELKKFMDEASKTNMSSKEMGEGDEKRMSAIASDIQNLHNEYKELVTLVTGEIGLSADELE